MDELPLLKAELRPQEILRGGASLKGGEAVRDAEGVDQMLRRMVGLWKNNPRLAPSLKPTTLFGDKFHDYYGQRALPIAAT